MMVNLGETVTEEEVLEMMREVDLDGNGQIDFDGALYVIVKKSSFVCHALLVR